MYESVRFSLPLSADILVWRQASEPLEPLGVVVGQQETQHMLAQLLVTAVIVELHRRLLERPVHALDLSVCPRMPDLGEPVLHAVLGTDSVKEIAEGLPVASPVSELDAVVGQHRMEPVRKGLDDSSKKADGRGSFRLLMQFGIADLSRPPWRGGVRSMATKR